MIQGTCAHRIRRGRSNLGPCAARWRLDLRRSLRAQPLRVAERKAAAEALGKWFDKFSSHGTSDSQAALKDLL